MTKQVWKYVLEITDSVQNIEMPAEAKLVHVGSQEERNICLWFEVNWSHPKGEQSIIRAFRVHGTGHPIAMGNHIGTVVIMPLVWHIYEI